MDTERIANGQTNRSQWWIITFREERNIDWGLGRSCQGFDDAASARLFHLRQIQADPRGQPTAADLELFRP